MKFTSLKVLLLILAISVVALVFITFSSKQAGLVPDVESEIEVMTAEAEQRARYPGIPPNALLSDCPGEERVNELFSNLQAGLPDAPYDEKLSVWNDLMVRNGCHEFVIPYGEPVELMRRATTTDTPGYFVMECPGIEFVLASYETWIVQYEEANPDATYEERMATWDKLLRAIACDEFTSENIFKEAN